MGQKNAVWSTTKCLSPQQTIPPHATLKYKGTQLYMQEEVMEPVPPLLMEQSRASSTVPQISTDTSPERTHKWPVKSLACDHFSHQPWISVRESVQPTSGWKFDPGTKQFVMVEVPSEP